MKIDMVLFTIALALVFVITFITFMMKSLLIEIMLPLLMVVSVLYVGYLFFTALRGTN